MSHSTQTQHNATLQPFDRVRAKCGAPVVTKFGASVQLAFFPTMIAVYEAPDPADADDLGDVVTTNLDGEWRQLDGWEPYLFIVPEPAAITQADLDGALKDMQLMRALMKLFMEDGTDWETARVLVARGKNWTMGSATHFLTQCEQVTGMKLER